MSSKFVRKGMIVAMVAGMLIIPTGSAFAAEATALWNLPRQEKSDEATHNTLSNVAAELADQTKQAKTLKIESVEEIKLNDMLGKMAFAEVGEEGYLLVKGAAQSEAENVGKLYADSILTVVDRTESWTEILSGNVTGFIETASLLTGKEAVAYAKAQLEVKFPETELAELDRETIDGSFTTGETFAEETERLAAEEAARIAAEKARVEAEKARVEAEKAARRAKGQEVVDYAKQFLGNPYVYGGTSLTRGIDCSGFVMKVYEHFGISMSHSSYAQRHVGYAVSYDEMMPGDIVCYSGHVGIYAGNGKIINAADERGGIKYSNVGYKRIIAIRRMF